MSSEREAWSLLRDTEPLGEDINPNTMERGTLSYNLTAAALQLSNWQLRTLLLSGADPNKVMAQ